VVRFVDARSGEETGQIKDAHEGAKSIKLCYLGAKEKMVSFGFTKQSQRQLKVWWARGGESEQQQKQHLLPLFPLTLSLSLSLSLSLYLSLCISLSLGSSLAPLSCISLSCLVLVLWLALSPVPH
jgi:hypothetical protein